MPKTLRPLHNAGHDGESVSCSSAGGGLGRHPEAEKECRRVLDTPKLLAVLELPWYHNLSYDLALCPIPAV